MSHPGTYTCPRCGDRYKANWEWVCTGCVIDEILEALTGVVAELERATNTTSICPADGCLLAVAETCPACILRRQQTAQAMTARASKGTVLPPLGWIRRGPILVRKKAA